MYSASQREVGEHSDRVGLEVGAEFFDGSKDNEWKNAVDDAKLLLKFCKTASML